MPSILSHPAHLSTPAAVATVSKSNDPDDDARPLSSFAFAKTPRSREPHLREGHPSPTLGEKALPPPPPAVLDDPHGDVDGASAPDSPSSNSSLSAEGVAPSPVEKVSHPPPTNEPGSLLVPPRHILPSRYSQDSTSELGGHTTDQHMDLSASSSVYISRSINTTGSSSARTSNSSSHCPPSTMPTTVSIVSIPPQSTTEAPLSAVGVCDGGGMEVEERGAERDSAAEERGVDPTADLIRRLYERLDNVGVPGDGWEEGVERSRDGIINRVAKGERRESRFGVSEGREVRVADDADEFPSKEEKILKRVDRYGFFSNSHPAALACQYNRLATLSSTPYQTLAGPSSYRPNGLLSNLFSASSSKGQAPSSPHPPKPKLSHRTSTASLMTTLTPDEISLELKRITKWYEMLKVVKVDAGGNAQEWDVDSSWWRGRETGGGSYKKFQKRVFKGVPDRWRRAAWGLEMERVATEEKGKGKGRVPSLDQLEEEYQQLITRPSNQDIQIDLDVPRTISGHVLFHTRYGQGQRALFHVLHAFGLHCEDIGGYCQGMGPIAATFLNYFEPERAFACLVRLFDQYGLRHIFEPGFPGLVESFFVQEKLVEYLMPDVHAAFTQNGISTSAYATKWYITLFANSVPFGTQLRLWDGLLLEGLDFLVVTAVAIIWCFKQQFTAPGASFESILSVLSSYFLVESDDALLRWIRKVIRRQDLRQRMKGWRAEWEGYVRDGQAVNRIT